MTDDGSMSGAVSEAKFLEKLTQLKETKRGIVIYEDGTKYDGGRANGRPQGRGSLIFPEKLGTYDGDFQSGRRHGYGIQNSYIGSDH